jgi:hypothetical protein
MMIRSVVVSMSSSLEFLKRSPGRGQGLRNCLYRLLLRGGTPPVTLNGEPSPRQ